MNRNSQLTSCFEVSTCAISTCSFDAQDPYGEGLVPTGGLNTQYCFVWFLTLFHYSKDMCRL